VVGRDNGTCTATGNTTGDMADDLQTGAHKRLMQIERYPSNLLAAMTKV